MMNLRDQATVDWAKQKRPDLAPMLSELLTRGLGNASVDDAYRLLLSIGFEAGRKFQADRPNADLNNPNIYLGIG